MHDPLPEVTFVNQHAYSLLSVTEQLAFIVGCGSISLLVASTCVASISFTLMLQSGSSPSLLLSLCWHMAPDIQPS